MTIQQFIEKHSLYPVQLGDRKPAVLLMGDRDDPRRFDDCYEFYRNADRTIWVSINRTQNWFRIVYHDLLMVYSDWEKADGNYELAPLVPNQQPGMQSHGEPNAISNAVGYAKFYSRSHHTVIRVFDEAGNVVATEEHAGDFREPGNPLIE